MQIRKNFPLLKNKISNKQIIYFDNSATTQKPQIVIDAVTDFYENKNSNVHRSINPLAEIATREYEAARIAVRKFINAKKNNEIIFTSGATDGLNLVANILGKGVLKKDDVIVLSMAEHHANIIPWLMLKEAIGIKLEYIQIQKNYRLDIGQVKRILNNKKVRVLSIQHASNVLGIINPIKDLINICKKNNIISIIDAAASIAHTKINVQSLDCDFLVFSGHKIFAPTGVGVLYGKEDLLNRLPAWKGGGDMIREVSFEGFSVAELPYKFEAGTPHIAGVIGLGRALEFLESMGFKYIKQQELILTRYFLKAISKLNFIDLVGPFNIQDRLPIFSFSVQGVHPHDIADLLGERGIITRAGHHCVQPLHDKLSLPATLRASLSFYNTTEEIDIFVKEIIKIHKMFI
ncbi:SufS family cysteine desulfurase [Patescibacteria group bacterium]|nr:SufS family cysteine desulfurase [Patescibacteria group bacterium]